VDIWQLELLLLNIVFLPVYYIMEFIVCKPKL
jgi:hypothetical protein